MRRFMNIIKIKDRNELDKKVPLMPWYVEKFINYKLPDLSPSSLLEYVRDYETFFFLADGGGTYFCFIYSGDSD